MIYPNPAIESESVNEGPMLSEISDITDANNNPIGLFVEIEMENGMRMRRSFFNDDQFDRAYEWMKLYGIEPVKS